MDYEKKYKDALNLAKSYYGNGCNEFLDTIFPELRESEDERIRKYLLGMFPDPDDSWDGISARDIIVYLEKQKPVQLEEEKEYIRTLKSRIADFLRGKDKDEVDITYYQRICDWLDGRHVEQKPSEEQMDVDLEKEIIRYQREDMDRDTTVGDVARHFYELGLKAREKNK